MGEIKLMIGTGTLINGAGVVFGGILGSLFGSRISESSREGLIKATGTSTIFLGILGAVDKYLSSDKDTMLIIASLCLGAIIGEAIGIEDKMERLGIFLKGVSGSKEDAGFVDGFVSTSLTICIGAMAVVGSIQDGIYGDYSTLAAKAVLDMIFVMIMTASKGRGCIFSAVPLVAFQGSITLLSRVIEPVMTARALDNLSLVGSVLIFCVGANLVFDKKIRVGNLLPAIVIAVIYAFLPFK